MAPALSRHPAEGIADTAPFEARYNQTEAIGSHSLQACSGCHRAERQRFCCGTSSASTPKRWRAMLKTSQAAIKELTARPRGAAEFARYN